MPRNRVQEFCEKIEEAAVKEACWTCECLQGVIAQLLMDLEEEDISELEKRVRDREALHSCLGCDPCPPGELLAEYLRNRE
jgi:hypothetical protein